MIKILSTSVAVLTAFSSLTMTAGSEQPEMQKIWYMARAIDSINAGNATYRDGCFMTLSDIITGSCGANMGNASYCKIGETQYDYCRAAITIVCSEPSKEHKNLENCE